MLKKIFLALLTLSGFFLYGLLGVLLYPYFFITGFREKEVRYFFYCVSKCMFLVVRLSAKTFVAEKRVPLPEGGALLAANHSSILDILCFCEFGLKDVVFLAKGWPFKVPVMGSYVRAAGNIDLEKAGDFNGLKEKTAAALAKGLKVVVFPEGTRSADCKVHRFRSGAFALAAECDAPVYPVAIKGLGETIPKNGFWINSADIKLTLLPPVADWETGDTGALKMAKYVRRIIINELDSDKTQKDKK